MMIIVVGTVDVAPQDRAAFIDRQLDRIRATRAETGCLTCAFSADPIDAGRVLLLERWATRGDFQAHVASRQARPVVTHPDLIATVVSVSICHVDEERWLAGWGDGRENLDRAGPNQRP